MLQILQQEMMKLGLKPKAETKTTCFTGVQVWGSRKEWGKGSEVRRRKSKYVGYVFELIPDF